MRLPHEDDNNRFGSETLWKVKWKFFENALAATRKVLENTYVTAKPLFRLSQRKMRTLPPFVFGRVKTLIRASDNFREDYEGRHVRQLNFCSGCRSAR